MIEHQPDFADHPAHRFDPPAACLPTCPGCGQTSYSAEFSGACPACMRLSRAPQGDQLGLFAPLAPQLAGQTDFAAIAARHGIG